MVPQYLPLGHLFPWSPHILFNQHCSGNRNPCFCFMLSSQLPVVFLQEFDLALYVSRHLWVWGKEWAAGHQSRGWKGSPPVQGQQAPWSGIALWFSGLRAQHSQWVTFMVFESYHLLSTMLSILHMLSYYLTVLTSQTFHETTFFFFSHLQMRKWVWKLSVTAFIQFRSGRGRGGSQADSKACALSHLVLWPSLCFSMSSLAAFPILLLFYSPSL